MILGQYLVILKCIRTQDMLLCAVIQNPARIWWNNFKSEDEPKLVPKHTETESQNIFPRMYFA